MPFLPALKAVIASKAVAVGAGTALVAGGLAVAAPQTFLLEPVAGETADDGSVDTTDTTDEGNGTDPSDTGGTTGGTTDTDTDTDGTKETEETTDERSDLESLDEKDEDEEDADGEDGSEGQGETNRSQTAKDVHAAIAEHKPRRDSGVISGREFGKAVSAAARGERGSNGKGHDKVKDEGERSEEDLDAAVEPIEPPVTQEEQTVAPDGLTDGDDDGANAQGKGKSNRPAHAGGPKG